MENVLIASLGESPVVVTAMYDLLTQDSNKQIDRLVVLYPQGGLVKEAFDLIEEAMRDQPCAVEPIGLSITDVNTWRDCMRFLQSLFQRLANSQEKNDTVYLSLAGGRKSMSALMAWVIPYFSCIQELYHVIDRDEQDFWTVEQLILDLSTEQRRQAMHPDLSRLILVNIPLSSELHISNEIRDSLASMTDEELDDLQEKNAQRAEAIQFGRTIARNEKILQVMLTSHAAQQFRELAKKDHTHARNFEICFERMQSATALSGHVHHIESDESFTQKSINFHYFKHIPVERAVFYTVPKDVKSNPENVDTVVVCELELEINGKYRSIPEIVRASKFTVEPEVSIESLPSIRFRKDEGNILIVPLGERPMIATQLYALLKHQGQAIDEVVLVYPSSQKIINGAELVKKALKEEQGPPCRHVRIPGAQDIDSTEACEKFEKYLSDEIERAKKGHAEDHILLALSGGRKGMAALAMFVALRKRIPYLYHTLISNDTLERKVLKETSVSALSKPGLDKETRNDRLFLRAYAGADQELEQLFTLFTVPVLLPPE